MSYNNTIPKPTDTLQTSQADLLNNFIAINSFVDVDHKTFGDTNEGAHAKVTLPDNASTPAFSGTNSGIYSNTAFTMKNEIFVHGESLSNEIPMTAALYNESGWTYLPSGILLKWGTASATAVGAITFPTAATIPAFKAIFNVQLTTWSGLTSDDDVAIRLRSWSTLDFGVYASKRTQSASNTVYFKYLAIGR